MGTKRRPNRPCADEIRPTKKVKMIDRSSNAMCIVRDRLLTQYYNSVLTLRQYILLKLPETSKARRKLISSIGRVEAKDNAEKQVLLDSLSSYLDETLVGEVDGTDLLGVMYQQRWAEFSQKQDNSRSNIDGTSFLDRGAQQSEVSL